MNLEKFKSNVVLCLRVCGAGCLVPTLLEYERQSLVRLPSSHTACSQPACLVEARFRRPRVHVAMLLRNTAQDLQCLATVQRTIASTCQCVVATHAGCDPCPVQSQRTKRQRIGLTREVQRAVVSGICEPLLMPSGFGKWSLGRAICS